MGQHHTKSVTDSAGTQTSEEASNVSHESTTASKSVNATRKCQSKVRQFNRGDGVEALDS